MAFGKPRPLTITEIKDIVQRFAFAAKTLYDAGADGIQLQAAVGYVPLRDEPSDSDPQGQGGYLLSQFLSPRVNKRTDEYGGASLDNRSRIVFEIVDAIHQRVPDERFMLGIKINSADFAEGGFSAEDSREMVYRLEAAGVELIELSGGTYESLQITHRKESTRKREAFFIEYASPRTVQSLAR
jgi:2,4-dienoyl-CoA reductase-like NADH-dependent reductase (Old Yellow Enzyme family)